MNKKLTAAFLASAVAGLFLSGNVMAEEAPSGEEVKVKCEGTNACHGKGACKSEGNGCAGQNSCKGKGWEFKASKEECEKAGGKVAE